MRLVASGNNQQCDVKVEGMGKSQVIVTFDDKTHEITDIEFEGGRPSIQGAIKNRLNKFKKKEDEIRHIRSEEWIKEEITAQYLGKTAQSVMGARQNSFFATMGLPKIDKPDYSNCKNVTSLIAKQYLKNTAQTSSNFFTGDRYYNNFSGKLCAILKPYIENGKDAFEKKLPCVIPIPINAKYANDKDFFKIVRDELGTKKIEIESWDMLLELYFSVNYDEPKKKIPYKKIENENCQSRQDFLKTFEHYGAYTWQPALFPIKANAKKTKPPIASKDIMEESSSDEEKLNKKKKAQKIEQKVEYESDDDVFDSEEESSQLKNKPIKPKAKPSKKIMFYNDSDNEDVSEDERKPKKSNKEEINDDEEESSSDSSQFSR